MASAGKATRELSSPGALAGKELRKSMITRRALKAEVVRLTYRVQELEDRLCPCEQHDYIKVDTEYECSPVGVDAIGVYRCKRCGKKIKRYW